VWKGVRVSARKTERLFNLVICLLAARQYVSKERIRNTVVGYGDCATDEAFDRMFERDKDELREMGVPLEMGANSAIFDDELGYRIRPDRYALPELALEPAEASVLGLAARVWQHASMSSAASAALLKLRAAGVRVGDVDLPAIEPRIAIGEPAFEPLWRAVHERRPVSFDYRTAMATETETRTVEPWGVVSSRGRWYLVGHDRVRAATRVFRLDRIVGGRIRVFGAPGEVVIPAGSDPRALVRTSLRAAPRVEGTALLLVREGAGHPLRRQASSVKPSDERPGWDLVELPRLPRLGNWLPAFGADVLVLEPADLRAQVIDKLRLAAGERPAAVAEHGGGVDG
jgi:proteasome accessory factor B